MRDLKFPRFTEAFSRKLPKVLCAFPRAQFLGGWMPRHRVQVAFDLPQQGDGVSFVRLCAASWCAKKSMLGRSNYEKLTLGASFCSARSTTKSSAGPKLNMPAMMLLGNCSRFVL